MFHWYNFNPVQQRWQGKITRKNKKKGRASFIAVVQGERSELCIELRQKGQSFEQKW